MIPPIKGLGLNVDLNHFNDSSIQKIIKSLKKIQVGWVRIEIDYFKYKDPQKISHLLNFLKACHTEQIIVVGLFSQFVAGNIKGVFLSHHSNICVLDYLDDYLLFVENIVSQCKKYIFYWEIWNEQNSKRFWIKKPNAKEYVIFLKAMSELIQKTSPKSKIIFGGIVGNDVTPIVFLPAQLTQYVNFIEESISHGADNHVHYYGFHPYILDCYISYKNKYQLLELIKKRVYETKQKYPQYPLIITEFGISSTLQLNIKEEDIVYIYKNLLAFLEDLEIPLCIYTLIDLDDKHFFKFNPERGFGLLTNVLEEKKMFTHLSNSLVSLPNQQILLDV